MQLPVDSKAALRREARVRRASLAAAAPPDIAARFAAAAGALAIPPAPSAVSGYWPVRDEADPRPLLAALAAAGYDSCLPVSLSPDAPLVFRRWRFGDAVAPDPFGIPAPLADAPELQPDVMLVPLLAFDRRGHRLGYGAGLYDRTIAAARSARPLLAVGVAFAGQEMPRLPDAGHDVPLDWVITEREAIRTKG